ncbi:MAG: hypothetical protein IID61_13465 [SAR324 cluster bacterium]|nr:hypothetical protein [SAR324 cluster bacterium]
MDLGFNSPGQLGNGGVGLNSLTPVQVCDAGQTAPCSQFLSNVIGIAAGEDESVALKSDGTVWTWGSNSRGQLGDGTQTNSSVPVQVCETGQTYPCNLFLSTVIAIAAGDAFKVALKSDGTVWAWGTNSPPQLGIGTEFPTLITTPVQVCAAGQTSPCVSFLNKIIKISAKGFHTQALKSDGTLWSWGRNLTGGLGDGSTSSRSTPVQVCDTGQIFPCSSFLTDVSAIAAGTLHGVALKSNGTVWAWGENEDGRLGDGTFNDVLSPVQVCDAGQSAPCSSFLTGVSTVWGSGHTLVRKSDGTVWAFGPSFSSVPQQITGFDP